MEYFVATPLTPLDTALENVRNCDVMILLIGFKAGSLLADNSGSTYTSAEYDELLRLEKEPLVFLKRKKWPGQKIPSWRNQERTLQKRKALDEFKAKVGKKWHWDEFTTADQLALAVIQALNQWEARGRPGARYTFASTAEYFAGKNSAGHFRILDFSTIPVGAMARPRS